MKNKVLIMVLIFAMLSSLVVFPDAAVATGSSTNILVYDGVVSSITTSIPTRNAVYHSAEKMIDGSLVGDNYFKTDNSKDRTDDLVITIKLSDVHSIDAVSIYERFVTTVCSDSVKIQVGTSSSLATAISHGSLNSGGNGAAVRNHYVFDKAYQGDTIVVTFLGGKGGKDEIYSQYEIYEIEVYEDLKIDGNILASHTKEITASIKNSHPTYHPPLKMVDGSFSGDDYYKSINTSDDNTDLVITIKLDKICLIGQIKVFERYIASYGVCSDSVTIKIGDGTNMTTVVSGGTLSTGRSYSAVESVFNIVPRAYGDTIEIIFAGTEDRGTSGECTYQIYEIEAYSDTESELYMCKNSPRARVNGYVCYIDETNADVMPEIVDYTFMAPASFLADALNLKFSGSPDEATISGEHKSVTFTSGINTCSSSSGNIVMSAVPYTKHGHLYIPAYALCEAMDIGYESDDCGLFLAGDFAVIDWNNLEQFKLITEKLRDVVYGEIPLPSDVIARLKVKNPNNQHPRLLIPQGMSVKDLRTRIKYEPYKTWSETIIAGADSYIADKEENPFEYVIPDGIRLYNVSERAMNYIGDIAFTYLMTGDIRYADEAIDIMMTVCAFPDWNPKHFLDVGKMASAVALGYDWCYDRLTPIQKETIKKTLVDYALKPVMEDYNELPRTRTYYWSSSTSLAYPNNWIAVCASGTTMAALAIGDEDLGDFTEAGNVVTEGMDRLKDLLDTYLPDGGFLDGTSYWRFAMEYIGFYVGSMRSALGTDYNISNAPGLNITFEWIEKLTGPTGPFNFDTSGDEYVDSPEFILFGEITDNPAYIDFRVNQQINNKGIAPHYKDILWYDNTVDHENLKLPLDFHSRGATNVYVTRSGYDKDDAWAAMYAGYRKKAVSAMQDFDGTFVFDMLGTRWALDYGGEKQTYYNTGYAFTDYYICRAEGHNTIILTEGDEHDHDPYACGILERSESNERSSYAVYDLTDQLDDKGASLWRRGMMMDRITQKITVQDQLEIEDGDSMFYWFMHTKAEINLADDGKSAILTIGKKQIQARLITDNESLVFTVMAAEPLPGSPNPEVQHSTEGTRKLAVYSPSVSSVNMAVEFVPLYNGTTDVKTEPLTSMDSWSLKEKSGVKVRNSYSENNGSGEYSYGETVTIDAGTKDNATFSHWEAEGITLEDPTSPTLTFSMPANSVTLTAKWQGLDFFDFNFDNWTSATDFTDSDGKSTGYGWQSDYAPYSADLYTDPIRLSQGLKITTSADSTHNHSRLYVYPEGQTAFGDYVLWTEISVKFEDQFVGFGWDHTRGTAPIRIGTDGVVYYFGSVGKSTHANNGFSLGYQLEFGKWYHIVLAMDCANAPAGDGGPIHLWINGKKICNGEPKYTNSNFKKEDNNFNYLRFVVESPDEGYANVCIDNFKFYTTESIDTHATDNFEAARLSSDEYFVDLNKVYVPMGTTASQFLSSVSLPGTKLLKGNVTLSGNDILTTGTTVYSNADNGIGFLSYEIVADISCSLIADTIYQSNDKFSIDCINLKNEPTKAQIFVATYDGAKLIQVSQPKKITLPSGRTEIDSVDTSFVEEGKNYKVFIWDDLCTAAPLCVNAEFTKK